MHRFKINYLYLIISIALLFFVMQNFVENSKITFGINILFLKYNFYFQPLTSIFMHDGVLHLAMNMAVLFQFWTILENHISSIMLFWIFILGGIIVSLLSFAYTYMLDINSTTLGASGAISIFIGVMAYIDRYRRKGLVLFILLISFMPMLFSINVAWYAHLFGFAIGFLWTHLKIKSL